MKGGRGGLPFHFSSVNENKGKRKKKREVGGRGSRVGGKRRQQQTAAEAASRERYQKKKRNKKKKKNKKSNVTRNTRIVLKSFLGGARLIFKLLGAEICVKKNGKEMEGGIRAHFNQALIELKTRDIILRVDQVSLTRNWNLHGWEDS